MTDSMIVKNLPLVYHIVGKFWASNYLDRDDLRAAGFLGLVKAAHRWDGKRLFVTYAYHLICGEILNMIRGSYGIPTYRGKGKEVNRKHVSLQDAFGVHCPVDSILRRDDYHYLSEESWELLDARFNQGYLNTELAARCGITPQAIQHRFKQIFRRIRTREYATEIHR